MKKAIFGIVTLLLAIASVYSYAAKDKDINTSVGICAGHYFMTKQYDMAQMIVNRATDTDKMKKAANEWMDVIFDDDKNGTFHASDQAEQACKDLKIKTFPN